MATHALKHESPFSAWIATLAATTLRAMEIIDKARGLNESKAELEDLRRVLIDGSFKFFQLVDEGFAELEASYNQIPFDRFDDKATSTLDRLEASLYAAIDDCIPPILKVVSKMEETPQVAEIRRRAAKYLEDARIGRMTDQEVFAGTPERAAYLDRLIELSVEEVAAGHTEPLLPIP